MNEEIIRKLVEYIDAKLDFHKYAHMSYMGSPDPAYRQDLRKLKDLRENLIFGTKPTQTNKRS